MFLKFTKYIKIDNRQEASKPLRSTWSVLARIQELCSLSLQRSLSSTGELLEEQGLR